MIVCACSVNPGKCYWDCKHDKFHSDCGSCDVVHDCICQKILDREDKYKGENIYCRANEHNHIDHPQCECIDCNVEILDDCENSKCNNEATIKCPICTKIGLPDLRFCSTKCFKDSWQEHKKKHNVKGLCINCFEKAKLVCPLCFHKEDKTPKYCSTDCFRKGWSKHKKEVHEEELRKQFKAEEA